MHASSRWSSVVGIALGAALSLSFPLRVRAATFDATVKPGVNFDHADFRLWYPDDVKVIRAIVVLVPGSNGDGRSMAGDPFWQAFATKHQLALVGCRLTDKPHPDAFVEEYVDVSKGSGQAFLDALADLGARAKHPELASAPLMLWGMSAGGEFDYEFAAWKPERVIAFIVNKGNIYYTALVSKAARDVPAILFTGAKDLDFRINTINGLFALNRRGGALWALAQEPGIGHEVGRSKDLGAMLFEDVMAVRLPADADASAGPVTLRPMTEKSGFIGDLTAQTFAPMGDSRAPNHVTAWLPTERVAQAWQAVITGKPFPPH